MSENTNFIPELLNAFKFKGNFKNVNQIHDGHINNTFVLEFEEENGHINRYLVQEINTYVFKNPDALMSNVVGVTDYLHNKIIENGGDPEREGLYVFFTNDDKPYYVSEDNKYWRCYNFIHVFIKDNSVATFCLDTKEFYHNGKNAAGT